MLYSFCLVLIVSVTGDVAEATSRKEAAIQDAIVALGQRALEIDPHDDSAYIQVLVTARDLHESAKRLDIPNAERRDELIHDTGKLLAEIEGLRREVDPSAASPPVEPRTPVIKPIDGMTPTAGGMSQEGAHSLLNQVRSLAKGVKRQRGVMKDLTQKQLAVPGSGPNPRVQEIEADIRDALDGTRSELSRHIAACLQMGRALLSDAEADVESYRKDGEVVLDYGAYNVSENLQFAWDLAAVGLELERQVGGDETVRWREAAQTAKQLLEKAGLSLREFL